MTKSIRGEGGIVSSSDFAAMYADAAERYGDFSRGVSLAHADDTGLKGVRRIAVLLWDSMIRMPALRSNFDNACMMRIAFPYHDTPADVLTKLAYPTHNFR